MNRYRRGKPKKRGRPRITEGDIQVIVAIDHDKPLLTFERIKLRDLLLTTATDPNSESRDVSCDVS